MCTELFNAVYSGVPDADLEEDEEPEAEEEEDAAALDASINGTSKNKENMWSFDLLRILPCFTLSSPQNMWSLFQYCGDLYVLGESMNRF